MAETQAQLAALDTLMADLGRALAAQDWTELARLNGQIKPLLDPLLDSLEAGELAAEPIRTRLEELQQFVDAASGGASKARKEAEDALKGMNRNSSAARAYQNVSSNRPK